MRSRRSLLAAAVPLLVGGCLGDSPPPDQSSTATSETDQRSPSQPDEPDSPTTTPDCMRGYTLDISNFRPSGQLVTGFRPAQQRLVDRIFTEDGVVLQTYGQRPIRTEQYTLHDEAYYRIDYEQTGTEEVQAKNAELSWEKGQEAPDDKAVLNYTDLPEVDQHALEYLILGPEYSREGLPTQGLSVGDSPAPYPQGIADSELVGAGTRWVEWDNRVYRVTISTDDRTNTRRIFDYTATRVADTREGFREYVAERYLHPLESISNEEKSVLEAAIDADEGGRYEECNERSSGYKKLERRMDNLSGLPDPKNNNWYISYERERYSLEMRSWVV